MAKRYNRKVNHLDAILANKPVWDTKFQKEKLLQDFIQVWHIDGKLCEVNIISSSKKRIGIIPS